MDAYEEANSYFQRNLESLSDSKGGQYVLIGKKEVHAASNDKYKLMDDNFRIGSPTTFLFYVPAREEMENIKFFLL